MRKFSCKLSLVHSHSSTLMQLLFSFDQSNRFEKTLVQTLACQLSSTLMQLLFSFDQSNRFEKTLVQTLACQLLSTLMQLLFSFDHDTRVEKTLMQTLACPLSFINSQCNSCSRLTKATELRKLPCKLSLVNSHQLSCNSCSRLTKVEQNVQSSSTIYHVYKDRGLLALQLVVLKTPTAYSRC